MCGIAGILGSDNLEKDQSNLYAITHSQNYRGPDNTSFINILTHNGYMLFGHNRLSVIDLSIDANQPMWDCGKQFCVVFNGEIYNYLELKKELISLGHNFQTQSDTEVLLIAYKQWGFDAINRLNGPFAFAIFNKLTNELLLCRDRFGVKPLYYLIEKNKIIFASTSAEMARLFECKPNLTYISRGTSQLIFEDDTSDTIYHNIISLLPGHCLSLKLNTTSSLSAKLKKYYDLSGCVQSLQESLTESSTQQYEYLLGDILKQAIEVRLRSDVSIGVSLSGGLDSTSIAAIARKQQPAMTGFSYGSPDDIFSEGPKLAQLAQSNDFRVEYINPEPKIFAQNILSTIHAQDAPFSSLSIIAQNFVYQAAKKTGVTVMFGGQGADEVLMGYRKFQLYFMQQLLAEKQYLDAFTFALQLFPTFIAELSQFKLYWSHRNRYKNNNVAVSPMLLPQATPHASMSTKKDIFARQMLDITTFSLPTLLRYEDRNSMWHGIESRLPFLDYRMVEFGLALPTTLKLNKGFGKWLLRQITKNQIPDTIRLDRKKRGFDVNTSNLITKGVGREIRHLLHERHEKIRDYLPHREMIDRSFSDANLIGRYSAIAEVTSLIWLGEKF